MLAVAFNNVLSLSFMGSILSIIILITKYILKDRLHPNWHYYIWLLVFFRVLIPYTTESTLSIFNLLPSITFEKEAMEQSIEKPNVSIDLSQSSATSLMQKVSDEKYIEQEKHKNSGNKSNLQMLSIIWVVGIFAIMINVFVVYIKFIFKTRSSIRCDDERILTIFDECKSILNIHTNIPIIIDSRPSTPFLFGLIRPKIIFSSMMINELSNAETRHVLMHELSHYKRKDILINWISFISQIIHWFNPLIWYSLSRMKDDCEIACDDYVLHYLNTLEHREYGNTIINILLKASSSFWTPIVSTMTNSKSNIERRLIRIMKFKEKSWKQIVISIVLLIIIITIGLTNSKRIQTNSDLINSGDIGIVDDGSVEGHEKEQFIKIIGVVKRVEELDHKFSNYYLTYQQYINELNELRSFFSEWADEENHYNRRYIPNPIDIRSYSQEQLDDIRNTEKNPSKIQVELSKIHNQIDKIYIFTKATISQELSSQNIFINRRYDIQKTGKKLKITSINSYIYDNKTEEEKIKYNKSGNEIVNYVYSFNPLE